MKTQLFTVRSAMNLGNSGGNSAAVLDSHQLAAAAAVAAAAHDDKETALLSEEEQELLLTKTNKLLAAVGLSAKGKYIHSTEELSRVASSLFVAIFESLFKMHISGIVRCPKSPTDYVTNAQLVIDRLSEQIQVDLKHITGDSIVNGDLRVLSNMVNILLRIVSLTRCDCDSLILKASLLYFISWVQCIVRGYCT